MFGQLYLHVERLGHTDNIGKRSEEMLRASLERDEADADAEVVIMDLG